MKNVVIPLFLLLSAGTALGQPTYLGDSACSGCHANMPSAGFFDGYMASGHPWKLFQTAGEIPGPMTWPMTPVPPLPVLNGNQLEWADVEYVIGNFFWKTRFVARDGYIHTGGANDLAQWNIATEEWVPYHPGELRSYNCGSCHTTGYSPEGNPDGQPGVVGTWAQEGVRCEACHGPSSEHVAGAFQVPPVLPPGGKECADCHFRDSQFRMPWSGGFIRHHQQSEDLAHSAHKDTHTCMTCHNPHRSVVYEDGGTIATCSDVGCHPGSFSDGYYAVAGMESLDCTDCHMPDMAKSAVAVNAYTGDVRSHLFQIMTDPVFGADNVYEDGGNMYWNQDANGDGFITLDYACLGCHIDNGPPLDIEVASAYAQEIHVQQAAFTADLNGDSLVNMTDFTTLLDAWGPCPEPCLPRCTGDIDEDCNVGITDFWMLLLNWDSG